MRDFGDVFMVERIVEGVKDNDLKGPVSALRFRVAWTGFPNEDTIEPWKTVRNLSEFRSFLEEHPSKLYNELVKRLPKSNTIESTDEQEVQENTVSKEPIKLATTKKKRLRQNTIEEEQGSRKSRRERKAVVTFDI